MKIQIYAKTLTPIIYPSVPSIRHTCSTLASVKEKFVPLAAPHGLAIRSFESRGNKKNR